MSDPEQRTQWADHLEDEAHAIAVQQSSAGGSHEPLAGPLPFSHNDMTDAVLQAVLAERERCAGIAMRFASDSGILEVLPEATSEQRAAAGCAAVRIADLLRAG